MARKNIIKLRVSDEEDKLIRELAQKCGMNISTYIRKSAINEKIIVCDNGMIYKLNSAVRAIGNNINQIARVANSTGSVSKQDIADIQNNYTALQKKISEITSGHIPA